MTRMTLALVAVLLTCSIAHAGGWASACVARQSPHSIGDAVPLIVRGLIDLAKDSTGGPDAGILQRLLGGHGVTLTEVSLDVRLDPPRWLLRYTLTFDGTVVRRETLIEPGHVRLTTEADGCFAGGDVTWVRFVVDGRNNASGQLLTLILDGYTPRGLFRNGPFARWQLGAGLDNALAGINDTLRAIVVRGEQHKLHALSREVRGRVNQIHVRGIR